MVNDVLNCHTFALFLAEAVLNDKFKKRLAVHTESFERPVHTAGAFPRPPPGQQLLRNQLMVAVLVSTLPGISLNGGTSGIFLVVGPIDLVLVGIKMCSAGWNLQVSALLQ